MNIRILDTPYGVCHLNVVPVRLAPDEGAKMVTQLLFGKLLRVLKKHNSWSCIRLLFDNTEGWVDNNQITKISDRGYRKSLRKEDKYAHKWLTSLRLRIGDDLFLHVPKGVTSSCGHPLHTSRSTQRPSNKGAVATALEYLNVPYLSDGKTSFDIDTSELVQIVFKLNGIHLPRAADRQALCGNAISFIEESQTGGLALFDDEKGSIIHVGILLGDNKIIHSYGKVRMDRLDHIGIFNSELHNYAYQLRTMHTIVSEELTAKG